MTAPNYCHACGMLHGEPWDTVYCIKSRVPFRPLPPSAKQAGIVSALTINDLRSREMMREIDAVEQRTFEWEPDGSPPASTIVRFTIEREARKNARLIGFYVEWLFNGVGYRAKDGDLNIDLGEGAVEIAAEKVEAALDANVLRDLLQTHIGEPVEAAEATHEARLADLRESGLGAVLREVELR